MPTFNEPLRLNNSGGVETISLHPDQAQLIIGGDGEDGDIFVRDNGNRTTIKLDGNSGDIVLSNGDCAEDFQVAENLDCGPGSVMVLQESGLLCPSWSEYDKRVVGVISGAGSYKPGIVLDRQPNQADQANRKPIALMGKVYCRATAEKAPIVAGDLLTSAIDGHAMKASDLGRAFGTIIGKALSSLPSGRGMIPIVIALQ